MGHPLPSAASSEQLDAIFRLAPNPVVILDRELTILAVNDAVLAATGSRRVDLVGKNHFDAFPPSPEDDRSEGLQPMRASIAEVIRTKLPHSMAIKRYDLRRHDTGEYEPRFWSLLNYPVLGSDGEVSCIVHQAEEVSELIALRQREAGHLAHRTHMEQAQAAVFASEERLRKALSIETVGVLFFNLDGRMVDANGTFLRMVGYSREELRSTVHWRQLTPDEFMAVTEKAAKELATRGTTSPYEKEFIRKDGSRFFGLFAPTVISGHGLAAECVEFIIDITARRRAEEALRESDRRKDEFLAILAHELRNPLTPLQNGLQLLERIAPASSAEAQVRSMMGRQLRHMVRLIDDLLDVSRITQGKVELKKERINLSDVVKQAVEANRPLVEERQHELQLRIPNEPVLVDADATRLSQVISNLLNNAAKYTAMGGVVTVELRREGAVAVLSVTDTGQGIPADMLGKVFDLFTQVNDYAIPSQGGLGIGLSIVKGLVELHGGSVRAECAGAGKGSVFVVRLPVAPDDRTPMAVAAPAAVISPRKVLVVDDNVDAADSLAHLLRHAGCDTRVAYDGAEAIAAATDYRPDVILLDIGLPKKNGYEVCMTIRRAFGKEAPVIVALSGWGQQQDRKKSANAGFDAHLVKPPEFSEVTRIVQSAPRQGTYKSADAE